MKTITIFFSLIAMLAIPAILFQSCKKDEEKPNELPTCIISSPVNNQELIKGDTVKISVESNDSDGNIIEVRIEIDGILNSSNSSYPYNYNWITNNESIGSHNIIATCIDNDGGSTSDEITITIIENCGGGGEPCPDTPTVTDADGNVYNTVKIGNQCWMAENLNYETTNSWWYDNSSANGDIYGRLYTWEAALTACPSGWSLPSDDEWKQMEIALGMSQSQADTTVWRGTDEGEKMKSKSGWYNNGNGTNSSGFNALPGGFRYINGSFGLLGDRSHWWSSSEYSSTNVWGRVLRYEGVQVLRGYDLKPYGFSIRCLKN